MFPSSECSCLVKVFFWFLQVFGSNGDLCFYSLFFVMLGNFQSEHLDFIVAAANLRAFNFSIPANRNRDFIKGHVSKVTVPPFKPRSG